MSRSARRHLPGKRGARAARPCCPACTPWRFSDISSGMCVQQCSPGARAGGRATRSTVPPIYSWSARTCGESAAQARCRAGKPFFRQSQQVCRALHCRCGAANRCAEAAGGCVNRAPSRGGARALATRGPAAPTGAGCSRVLTAARGMHGEMADRRHAGRVGRCGGWAGSFPCRLRLEGRSCCSHIVRRS